MTFARRARALDPALAIVALARQATVRTAVDAIRAGAIDVLPQPFRPATLRSVVRRALQHRRAPGRGALREGPPDAPGFPVALLAHELRVPGASLRRCLEAILRDFGGDLSGKARSLLENAGRRAGQAADLLDNWLTLLRLDERDAARPMEPLDLATVLREVAASAAELPEAAGRTVRFEGAAEVRIRGDRGALRELFANLVTNAVRYAGPHGQVTVTLSVRIGAAEAAVADDGPGIPADERERIFEPFYRGRAQREIPGDGLGLPIVRRIAEAHGGRIELDTEVGRGTTFRVILPRPPTAPDDPR
jgi:signal transduction histidine kinase